MFNKLQYISQGNSPAEQLMNIRKVLNAGCKWIQLRYKNAPYDELSILAVEVKLLCRQAGATFIINDNVALAKIIDADGVHLGLTDMPISEARSVLGNKIIGGTANTFEDVIKRIEENADYVGLGPLRFTTTKKNLSPELGYEGFASVTSQLAARGKYIPVYAIGGIVEDDITPLLDAGCYGVAVSGAITNASFTKELVSQLNNLLHGSVEYKR